MTKDNMIRFEKVIDHFRATAAKEMIDKTALPQHIRFVLCTM